MCINEYVVYHRAKLNKEYINAYFRYTKYTSIFNDISLLRILLITTCTRNQRGFAFAQHDPLQKRGSAPKQFPQKRDAAKDGMLYDPHRQPVIIQRP